MTLTSHKPAPSHCSLLHAFIRHDLTTAVGRVRRALSKEQLAYVARQHYAMPDSAACHNALQLVRQSSPEFLLNHCLRSYAFAVAMAHKTKQKIDQEVLFLGAVMHDLGLTEHCHSEETFEVAGARAARELCLQHNLSHSRADLVHEMVALHNSVGIADKKDAEIALLHFGAGADVAGLWLNDIHPQTLHEVLNDYPRLEFKEGMIKLLNEQISAKPHSYMAPMIRLGFLKKIRQAPFSS